MRDFEVDRFASAILADGAVEEGNAEGAEVATSAAETEAAGAAGVGSNDAANGGGDLGGVGREELFGAGSCVAEFKQGDGGAYASEAGGEFKLAEFFEGEDPSA